MSLQSSYDAVRRRVVSRLDEPRLQMGLLFLLALGARLTQLVLSPDNALAWSDAESYHRIAVNLGNGNGFSDPYIFSADPPLDDGRTAWRPPFFPLLAGAAYLVAGPHPLIAVGLQSLASAATVVVIYLLALELWRHGLVAAMAGLLASVFGPFILMATILMPETVFIFLVTLGILLILRAHTSGKIKYQVAAGAVLGLASLTKPEAAAFAALTILWLVGAGLWVARKRRTASGNALWASVRRPLRSAAVVTVVIVLTMTPWTIRNFMVFHEFIPLTTTFGFNLWAGNNPHVGPEIGARYAEISRQFLSDGRMLEGQQDKAYRRIVLAYIQQDPGAFLTRVKDRYLLYWRQGDMEDWLKPAFPWLPFKPVFYLGFLGMLLSLRRPLIAFPIFLPILFFPALYSVFGVSLSVHRWRLVTEPFWILLAAYALGLALHRLIGISRLVVSRFGPGEGAAVPGSPRRHPLV